MREFLGQGIEKVALLFLAFMVGVVTTWTSTFPFEPWVRNGLIGLQAGIAQVNQLVFGAPTDVWRPVANGTQPKIGVTVLDHDRVAHGLTLVTVGQSAHLIGLDGKPRHTWTAKYDSLPKEDDMPAAVGDDLRLYWQRAHALPNGELLAIVNQTNVSPDGLALIKLDRNSKPVWARHGHFHHDFDVARDGTIYIVDQQVREAPPVNIPSAVGPLLDDGVSLIGQTGVWIKRVSILDAFANSPFASLIERNVAVNKNHWGDYLHANNIDIADAATAARFDFVEVGDILISLREVDVIGVLDFQKETISWAARGSWSRQHDPDFLDNGNILVFDNKGHWERDGTSRVIEIEPKTQAIVWQYPRKDQARLWSDIRGEAQALANGNVLINEFSQRRLIEVTRAGDVVWEYRCPIRHAGNPPQICNTMSSRRYEASELSFAFNQVTAPSELRASINPD